MENKSTFLTVLAWLFIVGSGFASLISIMQVVMVSAMLPAEQLHSIPQDAPAFAKIIGNNIQLFVYGFSLICLGTFVSSIGLLKRKNWARIIFIAILSLGVIWQIAGVSMQLLMFSDFPKHPAGGGFEKFESVQRMIVPVSLIISVALCILFSWIIKKLLTAPISMEFTLNKSRQQDAGSAGASA